MRVIPYVLLLILGGRDSSGQRVVGEVALPAPSGEHVVKIEDVSPDAGFLSPHPNNVPWGVLYSVSPSGSQRAAGPATGWSVPNGPVVVDHVASVAPDSHLIVFYWSPASESDAPRTQTAAWKAVDVTGKTGQLLAVEQLTSWTTRQDGVLVEHVAGRSPSGNLLEFSWKPGRDWTAADLSAIPGGRHIAGPPSGWVSHAGTQAVENIGARGPDDSLLLFTRGAGGSGWTVTTH